MEELDESDDLKRRELAYGGLRLSVQDGLALMQGRLVSSASVPLSGTSTNTFTRKLEGGGGKTALLVARLPPDCRPPQDITCFVAHQQGRIVGLALGDEESTAAMVTLSAEDGGVWVHVAPGKHHEIPFGFVLHFSGIMFPVGVESQFKGEVDKGNLQSYWTREMLRKLTVVLD